MTHARLPGLLALVLAAGAGLTTARADDAQVRKELVAQYARYSAAHKKQDLKALMEFYAGEFTGIDEVGARRNRQEEEAYWRTAFAPGAPQTTVPLAITIEQLKVDGDRAVARIRATTSWTFTDASGKHTGSIDGHWDDTWIKTPTGWKLLRGAQLPGTKLFRDGKPVAPQAPAKR